MKEIGSARLARQREGVSDHPDIGETDFPDMVQYATDCIYEANEEEPRFFEYMGNVARVYTTADKKNRIEILDEKKFKHEVNAVTTWIETKMRGEAVTQREVSMPFDVASHLFGGRVIAYLPLSGIINTPAFTRDGDLITVPGYHVASGLYYKPDNSLDVPQVSKEPTEEEVFEAKRLFIEELVGDFPLGGYTRDELMEKALHGAGVPAVTHIIGMIVLMFCRDLIVGPTPGHLLTKPSPATGASLLTDVCTTLANGEVTAPMTLPPSDEEMQKTLVSTMADGSNVLYFDNIDKDVNSGVLASAMTAPKAKGRMLGHSSMLEAEVRCVWILCGNNVRLSHELIRRLVMVDLDAKMEFPEDRDGWRHDDIIAWVTENRGLLVWAALTLIQNWIAKGKKMQSKNILNSYENWSRIIGGICEAAGLGGFLENREHLKESATVEGDETLRLFLIELAKKGTGTKFRAGSTSGGAVSIQDVLNDGCEDNGDKAFKMKHWGVNPETGNYQEAGAIGRKFRELAAKPHTVIVDGVKKQLTFEREADTKNGTFFYISKVADL